MLDLGRGGGGRIAGGHLLHVRLRVVGVARGRGGCCFDVAVKLLAGGRFFILFNFPWKCIKFSMETRVKNVNLHGNITI